MTTHRCLPLLLALLLALPAVPASAQSRDQPPTNVRWWKETYVVLGDDAREVHGRILTLTSDQVVLDVQGTRRVFELADVSRIQVRGDGVRDGAATGAGVAFALLCIFACGDGLFSHPEGRGAVVGSFLYGALIGAGVDALHTGRTTIYPARSPGAPARAASRRVISYTIRF